MNNKVIVITGASTGIGAALAHVLASRGASLILVARRADALQEVAARCGPQAQAVVADVTERSEVRRVVAQALARFGRIDVWVNNVGQGITRLPSELTGDDVDDMVRVNVKSALYGMQEVLPHFIERGSGHVINVSSMLGRIPFAVSRSAYCGAKHFLNALTAMFRTEIQQDHPGIQFSLVSPNIVRTNSRERASWRAGLHAAGFGERGKWPRSSPRSSARRSRMSTRDRVRTRAWSRTTGNSVWTSRRMFRSPRRPHDVVSGFAPDDVVSGSAPHDVVSGFSRT